MKKIMKKALSLALAVVMMLSLAPMTAKAATANVSTFNPDGTTEYIVEASSGGVYAGDCYKYTWTPSVSGTLTLTATTNDVWVDVFCSADYSGGVLIYDAEDYTDKSAEIKVNAGGTYVISVATWSEAVGAVGFTAAFEEGATLVGSGTYEDPYIVSDGSTIPALGYGEIAYCAYKGENSKSYSIAVTGSGRMDYFDLVGISSTVETSAMMGMANATISPYASGAVIFLIANTNLGDGGPYTILINEVSQSSSSVGTEDDPDTLPIGEDTQIELIANARGSYLYYYTWTAIDTGKLTIRTYPMGCTGYNWMYSVSGGEWDAILPSSANGDSVVGEYYVKAGEEIKVWFAMPDYSAGSVAFGATFETCEYPAVEGPKFESVTDDNYQMATTELEVGSNDVNVSENDVTLYEFTAETHAVYEISVETGYIGFWGTAGTLATTGTLTNPNSTVQTIEVTLKANETAILGLTDVSDDTATIEVKKVGDVEDEENLPWTEYENKAEIKEYAFDGTFDASENYVDVEDDVVDKAVLGEDGYYHLNSADGPILLVKLDGLYGTINPLVSAQNTQLKGYDADGAKWDYSAAYLEYFEAADETTGLYPLTSDLITILQNAGAAQGWYNADLGGVTTEDGWMFNIYYVPSTEDDTTEDDTTTDDTTTGGTTTTDTTAGTTTDTTDSTVKTGDTTNYVLWISILGLGVVAVAAAVVMKKRAR